MTARTLAVAALTALALAAGGCGSGGRAFRIGVLTDCQGPLKWAGEAELSAVELPLLRRGARLAGRAPSDGTTQWAAGLGTYAYDVLGWRRATILAGDEPSGWDGSAAFVAEFCALGGKVDAEVSRSPFEPEPNRKVVSRALAARDDGVASFLTDFDASTSVVGLLAKRLG